MTAGLIGPLKIKSLAFGGNGVARFEGKVVFVRGAVPGDVVWGRVLIKKKRYVEVEAIRFEQSATQRCEPLCPVFGDCGGCQWQMLSYAQQLQYKKQIFQDILMRHCDIEGEQISTILESPTAWNYRSRVQFKCRGLDDGQLLIGFYRPGSHYVVDAPTCSVAAPVFNRLLPRLRRLFHKTPCVDQITQIDMETGDFAQVRLVVHYRGPDERALRQILAPLLQDDSLAVFIKAGHPCHLHQLGGPRQLTIEVDEPPLQLAYAAGGFSQINLAQNRRMVAEALRMTAPESDWRVLDLYCGMGNFSLPFARRVKELVAVEDFAGSVAQGRVNAQQNRIDNLEFHAGSACGAFAAFSGTDGFDLVILDPPRSGAKKVVVDLVARQVKRILYVSCDPMTLARDLKILLSGGYRLVESLPIDMFPQTWHLESLSLLVRD